MPTRVAASRYLRFAFPLTATFVIPQLLAAESPQPQGGAQPLNPISTQNCETKDTYKYSDLAQGYNDPRKWALLQTTLRKIKSENTCKTPLPAGGSSFVFLFLDESTNAYRRVVVYEGLQSFRATRILGKRVYDIHISIAPESAPITTTYWYTPLENPLVGAISKLLGLVASSYAKATTLGPAIARATAVEESVKLKLDVAELDVADLERAKLLIQDTATAKTATPVLSSTYILGPLTTLEIGLGAGFAIRTTLNQPAKVDSSKNLVDDTPSGLMTYAAINWRPWGFNESAKVPDFRERFRIVLGPILTPDPGLVAGVGYAPIPGLRQISIQGGFGIMLANVLRTEDSLGTPPSNAAHPTRRGALGAWFLGVGYGLQ